MRNENLHGLKYTDGTTEYQDDAKKIISRYI